EAQAALPEELLDGPNQSVFTTVRDLLAEAGAAMDRHLERALEALGSAWKQLQDQQRALATAHGAQEIAYRELLEQHHAALGEATRRAALDKRRNDLLLRKAELDQQEARLEALRHDREGRRQRLSDLRRQRFAARQAICERLT